MTLTSLLYNVLLKQQLITQLQYIVPEFKLLQHTLIKRSAKFIWSHSSHVRSLYLCISFYICSSTGRNIEWKWAKETRARNGDHLWARLAKKLNRWHWKNLVSFILQSTLTVRYQNLNLINVLTCITHWPIGLDSVTHCDLILHVYY